jgi:hypothetical protein
LFGVFAALDITNDKPAPDPRTRYAIGSTPREIEAGRQLTRHMLIPGNVLHALDDYPGSVQTTR